MSMYTYVFILKVYHVLFTPHYYDSITILYSKFLVGIIPFTLKQFIRNYTRVCEYQTHNYYRNIVCVHKFKNKFLKLTLKK